MNFMVFACTNAAYILLGSVLVILNLPVSYAVMMNLDLRLRYAVPLAYFITCTLAGASSVVKGIYRVSVYFIDPDGRQTNISAAYCIMNPFIFIDLYTFSAVALLLLANSIDRYLVVAYSLRYFYKTKKFVASQLLVAHVIAISILFISVVVVLMNNHYASTLQCRQSTYLPKELFTVLSFIRVTASALSILVMGLVLARLRLLSEDKSSVTSNARLAAFKRRQRGFTRIMLLSCTATLALDVVPNAVSAYAHLRNFSYIDNYTTFTRLITYFNAMNLVVATAVRQKEIREEVWMRTDAILKTLFCRKSSTQID